ncbi:hypothetical protein [Spirosoma aureum]|uniref:hypothetical protein n=1 Tax=Spirosoma aureum TaxID=2692134 RepID=UPI001E3C89F5|nr:hypothetical protein [Spirosoma aureum]
MKLLISSFFAGVLWLLRPDVAPLQSSIYRQATTATTVLYETSLRFNIYTFTITATDSGAVRDLAVKAYRGTLLLTNFHTRVDGAVTGAEVADLDNNRFPELYVYSTSDGSGSFGRVYGWQFLPERMAPIQTPNWLKGFEGYMGHDSLWVERDVLCRKFPIYNSGDANAEPTGGVKMQRYRLRPSGQSFTLIPDQPTDQSAGR